MASAVPNRQLQHVGKAQTTPFPIKQLVILAVCRICEPIAFMSIFPYVYYMIISFDITSDPRQIAIYAGMVTSSFAFAEFLTGVAWGRISDKIGRKPVLLAGLGGTALSMLVFGFAPNLPIALLGRALGGLLNGNMGVIQTTVAEIVTVKKHEAQAFTIMPFVWCLGSILGPALGGTLAQPCVSFPRLFPRGSIFDRFPFLLPNLVCAVILVVGVLIGIFFLEETHGDLKGRRDWGIETRRRLFNYWQTRQTSRIIVEKAAEANLQEEFALLEDEEPPGYRTTEGSPRQPSTPFCSPSTPAADAMTKDGRQSKSKRRGVGKVFTKQVVLNIAGFGILAYHSISFDQLMPVFLSEPVSMDPVSLPFHFTGGFGFSTKKIGSVLAVQGVYSMVAQLFLFPRAVNYFGTLNTYRFVIMTWPLLYLLIPYLVLLPQRLQMPGIYFCLLWKITAHTFAFPSNAILLRRSAPSLLVLGVVNGAGASTASLARAFGPTITGLIHSWGLDIGSSGVAWWMNGLICVVGALESLWIKEVEGSTSGPDRQGQDEERLAEEALIDPLTIDAAIDVAGDMAQHLGESHVAKGKPDSKLNIL